MATMTTKPEPLLKELNGTFKMDVTQIGFKDSVTDRIFSGTDEPRYTHQEGNDHEFSLRIKLFRNCDAQAMARSIMDAMAVLGLRQS